MQHQSILPPLPKHPGASSDWHYLREIKSYHQSLSEKTSANRREQGATGGPASPEFLDWEEKLLNFIGEEAIAGIDGGLEIPFCAKM